MAVEIISGATDTNNATVLYQNIYEEGTVTVSSETADGAGLNAVEDTTNDFWTGVGAISTITVDMGSAVECDCVGIAAHTLGTVGATFNVRTSVDGVTFTSVFSPIAPLTDETQMVIFPVTSSRYWRVSIGSGPASIGVIKLGKRLVFPNGVLSGGRFINHAQKVELMVNRSVKGQYLGTRIKRVGAEASVNFGLMDTDFVDNDMAVFEAHFNSGRTFFYAGSPLSWPLDYGYCWRDGNELGPQSEEGGTMHSVNMDIAVYVE